jgi:hypothetical protein
MGFVGAFHAVEHVAVARGVPAGHSARAIGASVVAARVVALLDAGRPGVACASLWSRSTPSLHGNGRVVGAVELARPRHDADGVVGVEAARAWVLEVACGVAAEERARGRPAGKSWPGVREAVSLSRGILGRRDGLDGLRREAGALLERQAAALDAVRYTLLQHGCWFEHMDGARDMAERRRVVGRGVLPFRVQAA